MAMGEPMAKSISSMGQTLDVKPAKAHGVEGEQPENRWPDFLRHGRLYHGH